MKALIVYESMFGNTRDIALAIAEGLAENAEVETVEVGNAPEILSGNVDFLIAGGPTHQFGMSRPGSRKQASDQSAGPLVSPGRGIREWLDAVEVVDNRMPFASFDTTMQSPRFLRYLGRASRSVAKRLQRKDLIPCVEAESFWVEGSAGPLVDGELERAREWARSISAVIHAKRELQATA